MESLFSGKMKTCTRNKIKAIEARYILFGSLIKIAAYPRSNQICDCTGDEEFSDFCLQCGDEKELIRLEKDTKNNFEIVDEVYETLINNACNFEKDGNLVESYAFANSEIDKTPIWTKILNVSVKILGGASIMAKGKIAVYANSNGLTKKVSKNYFLRAFSNRMASNGTPISEPADKVITIMNDSLTNISSLNGSIDTLSDRQKDEFSKVNQVIQNILSVMTLI